MFTTTDLFTNKCFSSPPNIGDKVNHIYALFKLGGFHIKNKVLNSKTFQGGESAKSLVAVILTINIPNLDQGGSQSECSLS